MKQSETIKTLLEGLEKAQADFPTLPKDTKGYTYKYTNLDTVISTLRPILSKNKIGFMQSLTTTEAGKPAITTRLFNSVGEWLEDTTPLPEVSLSKGNAAQNLGAAVTYMKRYTLCAMLGVSCDEDSDGRADENPVNNEQPQNNQKSGGQKQTNKAPALKGGNDTKEEHDKINSLLSQKYADGSPIFSKEDCNKVGSWRKERTAKEVIKYLTEQVAERRKAKESNADPFPEDIPYEEENPVRVTPEEEAGADAAFENVDVF